MQFSGERRASSTVVLEQLDIHMSPKMNPDPFLTPLFPQTEFTELTQNDRCKCKI